jgi:hypothetical protein
MKSDMDNKEWLNEYPSLKQVNENNPFTVPEGYFDKLEKNIISAVNLEELKTGKGFTVPENYFDELNSNIQSRINIEAYVNNPEHGHTVPDGYFDELEEQVNARILVEETMSGQESFSVPAGYFDKLSQAILDKTVNQDNVVAVNQNPIQIQRKGIVRKMFASATFRYAAAACFAVVIGAGILLKQAAAPVSTHNKSFLHEQLSSVSTDDIQSYLQDDVDANETQHTVIDEDAPVNTIDLSNALQKDAATSN